MKKNWLALILAGAMACSMTACGGSSGTPATAGGGDTASKGRALRLRTRGIRLRAKALKAVLAPAVFSGNQLFRR